MVVVVSQERLSLLRRVASRGLPGVLSWSAMTSTASDMVSPEAWDKALPTTVRHSISHSLTATVACASGLQVHQRSRQFIAAPN